MPNLQFQNNPYALFDPSQWSNQFSQFNNSPIPPASYAGWPTNALGQPIQMPAGMTLNQTPAQPQQPAQSNPSQSAFNAAMLNAMGQQAMASGAPGGFSGGGGTQTFAGQSGSGGANPALGNVVDMRGMLNQMQQPAAQAAPQSAMGSSGLTPQQYLQLRANPGMVTTPGATAPQAAQSYQPNSGVLQQFLAGWHPAASGAGSGFQQGFANALKGMGYR